LTRDEFCWSRSAADGTGAEQFARFESNCVVRQTSLWVLHVQRAVFVDALGLRFRKICVEAAT
jgi:hypothetical protein